MKARVQNALRPIKFVPRCGLDGDYGKGNSSPNLIVPRCGLDGDHGKPIVIKSRNTFVTVWDTRKDMVTNILGGFCRTHLSHWRTKKDTVFSVALFIDKIALFSREGCDVLYVLCMFCWRLPSRRD